VVEDDVSTLEMIVEVLRGHGYAVQYCGRWRKGSRQCS